MNKIFVAGAVVALAVAVGGASTASNDMPNGDVQGYGQVVSTGATVTGMTFHALPTDASKLAEVVFQTETDVSGKTAAMTLKNGSTVVGSPYTCSVTGSEGTWTITCPTPVNPLLDSFNTTGLTVLS